MYKNLDTVNCAAYVLLLFFALLQQSRAFGLGRHNSTLSHHTHQAVRN